MTNEEIKNRILMEMNDELTSDELRKLKMCLERNFYGVTVVDNCTDIVTVESVPNEKMISKFVFEQKIGGLSDNTIKQYKRETERFFSCNLLHTSSAIRTMLPTAIKAISDS